MSASLLIVNTSRARRIEPDPFDAAYYYALGAGHARYGRWDKAAQALRRAVDLHPAHYQAWTALGEAQLAQALLPQAYQSFSHALLSAPGHAPALLGQGRVACARLQFARADVLFRRALKADRGLGRAWAARIQLRRLRQDFDGAQALLTQAYCAATDASQRFWPQWADALMRRDQGDSAEAQRLLRQAIASLNPPPPLESYRLLNTLAELTEFSGPDGLCDESTSPEIIGALIALYSQSLALYPAQAAQWRRLARVYIRAGDFDQAMACLGKALEEDPSLIVCQYERSRILYWLGDLQTANEALGEVLAHAPGHRAAYDDLARNLLELGDTLGARRAVKRAADFPVEGY
ncbi:MAG: tetratricopeptide repeat protein [Vampirovibrionales bacterium]|nr:tetratricopeptide repeat protein [Vampirovibrionales bacterium]